MIRVLQDWHEVGEALLDLQHRALPTHETPQKNWDHRQLVEVLEHRGRALRILDLGCGAGHTLKLLHALGFGELHGLDLRLGWRLRAGQMVRLLRHRRRGLRLPYRLHRGDLGRLPFAAASFDVALAISVIEHGVDLEALTAEAARVLRPGGLLFLTSDYWQDPVRPESPGRAFGLPWRVLCRSDVEQLLALAGRAGLVPLEPGPVPPCDERTVTWQGVDYTFISLVLQRRSPERSSEPSPPLATGIC